MDILLLRHYLFYLCNWLIVKILFTFILNLIWLCCIFIEIEILLKLGLRIGSFDLRGPRGEGRPIYLVRVRMRDGLARSAANAGLYGWASPLTHPYLLHDVSNQSQRSILFGNLGNLLVLFIFRKNVFFTYFYFTGSTLLFPLYIKSRERKKKKLNSCFLLSFLFYE